MHVSVHSLFMLFSVILSCLMTKNKNCGVKIVHGR